MIRRIWDSNTNAIIVEGGFVTNAEDAALLEGEHNGNDSVTWGNLQR